MPRAPRAGGVRGAKAVKPLRVEVRRLIARPPAEVYRAWTTPSIITQWINRTEPVDRVVAEARVGGPFQVETYYRGGKPWRLDGEFLEVIPNRRLKFTWVTTDCPASLHSVVTVDLLDRNGQTEVVLVHQGFPDAKIRNDHEGGWKEIVQWIDEYGAG